MSVIEGLKQLIAAYEQQRDDLYVQLAAISKDLEKRKILLAAYQVVSADPVLYEQWVKSVQETPAPAPELVFVLDKPE